MCIIGQKRYLDSIVVFILELKKIFFQLLMDCAKILITMYVLPYANKYLPLFRVGIDVIFDLIFFFIYNRVCYLGLGWALAKVHLLPNLVELTQDDNQNVRAVAVSAVINCLPYLDKGNCFMAYRQIFNCIFLTLDTKAQTMSPLIMQLCIASMKEEGFASLSLSKDIGLLLTCMNGSMTQADLDALVGYYIELARRGLDIRKYNYQNADSSQVIICYILLN